MGNDALPINIDIDAAPVMLFLALFKRALDGRALPQDDPLPAGCIRCETNDRPAAPGAIALTAYPSDALLRYAAAMLERTGDGPF